MDGKKALLCPFCHEGLVEVPFAEVPKDIAERYAILGWSGDVDHKIGWHWCSECNSFNHLPTEEWFRKEVGL